MDYFQKEIPSGARLSLSSISMAFLGVCTFCTMLALPAAAQVQEIQLNDLSAFKDPGKSWQIVGGLTSDLNDANKFDVQKGNGILLNLPTKKAAGKDLYTQFEHGDMDLELDYMMAKGSNSGIYLQGLYELQLEDSWGKSTTSAASNGGVYERWDESRPQGQQGYQGYAPRQNVSRAPGLWQNLKISYQAPRFDEGGKKVENAKLLRVELNGVLIHENLELFGPTRGAMSQEEKAKGPLRFQGDHGAVAFQNMKVALYEKPRPELKDLSYKIYEGRFESQPKTFDDLPPEAEGTSVYLTSDLSAKAKQYLIYYTGTLDVKEAGEYSFDLQAPGGSGLVRINGKEVVPLKEWNGQGSIQLPKGETSFELMYSKYMDWVEPGLGLAVQGPGIRKYIISDGNVSGGNMPDPILVEASETPVLRSFMDIPDGPRVTHAISVGSPEQLHYTYDLDHGTLVQLWRGRFLDATPMWHDRGDGSSRPVGAVQHLTKQPQLTVAKLSSDKAAWVNDTTGSAYRPKGYVLDAQDRPTFKYQAYGTAFEDAIRVIEGGKGIKRELKVQKPVDNLYVRLAAGKSIEDMGKGMYVVDGKSYYLRLDDAAGAKPVVRNMAGVQELIIPVREKLSYSILF